MKRTLAAALCLITLFLCFSPAVAAVPTDAAQTERMENGDSLVWGVGEPLLREISEDAAARSFEKLLLLLKRLIYLFTGTKTTEQSKYLRYYDKNGALLWEATLTAEFAYSEKQVRCESARLSFVSLDPDWTVLSRQTEKAGNAARGTVAVRQTKLGVPLTTITKTITLTCDNHGNVT